MLGKKSIVLAVIFIALASFTCFAHPIAIDFSKLSRTDVGWIYLKLGYQHIIPLGFDHILFVTSIYLLNPKLNKVIWQATAFTVAHSITLGLAMYGFIKPPSNVVEPIIALSIVLVALENLFTSKLHPWRVVIIFMFGLVHGMGFASALTGLGLPQNEFLTGLLSFNAGVELGQISVILIAYFLFGFWFGEKPWYHRRIVVPLSLIIASVAFYWTIERMSATLSGAS